QPDHIPYIFHNNKQEFWFLASSVYRVSKFGAGGYAINKVVDVQDVFKSLGNVVVPNNSMVLTNTNKIVMNLNNAIGTDVVFDLHSRDNALIRYSEIYLRPPLNKAIEVSSRGAPIITTGTFTFTGDYLSSVDGKFYKGATIQITNPLVYQILTNELEKVTVGGRDMSADTVPLTNYRDFNIQLMNGTFSNPTKMSISLGVGADTHITVTSPGIITSTDLGSTSRAEFYSGRLIIFIGGTLFFSEPGTYNNFGTSNANAIIIPGLKNVIALLNVDGLLFFSDGVNLYTVKYQYQQGAPVSSMWEIKNLGEFNIVQDGILTIEGSIILVTNDGCFQVITSSIVEDRSLRTICVTSHCPHLFDIPPIRILDSTAQNVFFILRSDYTLVRFEIRNNMYAGTVWFLPRAHLLDANYGALNAVATSVSKLASKLSIDWLPQYRPDNNNVSRSTFSYLYNYNVFNWLDSATHVNGALYIEFEAISQTIFKLLKVDDFPVSTIIDAFNNQTALIPDEKILFQYEISQDVEKATVVSYINNTLTLNRPLDILPGQKITLLGSLMTKDDFPAGALDFYEENDTTYMYYCDGLRLNVVKYSKSLLDSLEGLSLGVGYHYDAYIHLLLGQMQKPHAKLSAWISHIDTTDYDITYISNHNSITDEVRNRELTPTLYRMEFPSFDYWSGAFPNLKITTPTGLYGCFNYLYVSIE
ncbi:MAG: hypothetical protein ACRCST_05415, partial [Turicibacter sp.]